MMTDRQSLRSLGIAGHGCGDVAVPRLSLALTPRTPR